MGSATTTRWQQVLNGQRQLALGGFLAPLKEEEEEEEEEGEEGEEEEEEEEEEEKHERKSWDEKGKKRRRI